MHQPRSPWSPQARRALREVLDHPSHDRAVELATSRSTAVRAALAADAATPVGVLIHLSMDPQAAVRAAVAANPSIVLAVSTVRRLATDRDLDVQMALAQNSAVTAPRRPVAA